MYNFCVAFTRNDFTESNNSTKYNDCLKFKCIDIATDNIVVYYGDLCTTFVLLLSETILLKATTVQNMMTV